MIHSETTIPPYLYTSMSVLSTCGILLATSFFVFNVHFRKNRYIIKNPFGVNDIQQYYTLLSSFIKLIPIKNMCVFQNILRRTML